MSNTVISLIFTVWKKEKFSFTEKKFRQINHLVISLVKPLLSFHEIFAKKVWVRISAISTLCIFRLWPTILLQIIRQIICWNDFTNFFVMIGVCTGNFRHYNTTVRKFRVINYLLSLSTDKYFVRLIYFFVIWKRWFHVNFEKKVNNTSILEVYFLWF